MKPRYRINHGLRMPLGFPPDGLTFGMEYQAQPQDTFIVTYPKCGTTWTQYIIWLLVHDGQPMPPTGNINKDIPHLEEVGKEVVKALPEPRFIKTHLPYHLTPKHPQAKYIYMARNPFDCVVSFYHHTRGFVQHYDFAEGTFDSFFTCFIAGEVDFGDYFDHLLGWYSQIEQVNFLFLTYEQLKRDTETVIRQIATFLGEEYQQKLNNPQILSDVITHSSFEQMKKDQQRWCSERPKKMPAFIRQGKVGDWRNYFSPQQEKELREKLIFKTQNTPLLELLWVF